MKPMPTTGGAPLALLLPMPIPLEGRTGFNSAGDENDGASGGTPCTGVAAGASSSMMLNNEVCFVAKTEGPGMRAGSGEGGAGHR